MKRLFVLMVVVMAFVAFPVSSQGPQANTDPQAGAHDPGTGLIVPELKEESQGIGQGLVDLVEEIDYLMKADEFMKALSDNGFYLMSMEDLISAVDAGDENLFILDVRPADMYDAGHIPGSVNVPDPELVEKMDMVPTEEKIVVVCQIDTNSASDVSVLRIFGDRDARVVLGGVPAWEAAGGKLMMT